MSVILLPDKWRRQPSGPVSVDWNNPLARGLVLAYVPTVPYNAARNTPAIVAPTLVPTSEGIALAGNGSTSYLKLAATPTLITGSYSSYSISALGAEWANSNAISQGVAFSETWSVRYFYGGGTRYVWASGVGNDVPAGSGAGGISRVGISVASGVSSGAKVFWNGALAITTTGTPPALSGSRSILVGRSEDVGGVTHQAANNNIILSLAWNRPLSADEMQEADKSPYAIFRKQPRILYFNTAGGGATIAGALESLTLSTFGATVGSARAVAAALESLALTTSAARVSSDRAITASVESISITTSPARIASDRAVAAATEQLTVTPATASVALVSGIAAGTEALSVTANPATVALAASIAATLEAITVTGLTATVSTSSNTNISAALESITVTVNPATVSRNTALAAALESLTVTPHAASIAVGQIVAAALESLTLTSYPAGIALDVAIAAQLEQINLTTLAAQVGLGTNVAALTEALTLTPHGATLTFAPSVGAATEYITLTTFAAVVGATEAALLSPGLEFTIPLSRLGYTIPLSRVHFTIPQE